MSNNNLKMPHTLCNSLETIETAGEYRFLALSPDGVTVLDSGVTPMDEWRFPAKVFKSERKR